GVDTGAFRQAAAEVADALKALTPEDPDLSAHGLYFRARRAVRELALANPALDFEGLILVRRGAKNLGLPANWQSNSSLKPAGFDNEIAVLSDFRSGGKLTTLFRPEGGRFVGDLDLHFDAARMLFSMPDERNRWGVFELEIDGAAAGALRQLKLIEQPDVGNYDACYMPDGNVIFTSTAPFIGVPCVRGNSHVTNLYLMESAGGNVRRLSFDQDHNWCPTVMNDGRVMYLRWEYSDIPHSNSRILFHMDPDGTKQMELYGSNSYWPNSVFYARPIPGHPSKVVGIVTGHHGVRRMGELVIFDPARGRQEADGVVQRIPGWGKTVEPIIRDRLVDSSWPKFLHPYPLNESYFLVSCKPTPSSLWGIYLVDVFDNMVLLAEQDAFAMLEPIPLRRTPPPPVIAGKVDLKRSDAVVYLVDVYRGGGLAGVPRGAVRELRLFTYHYSYQGTGGLLGVVGADGPWDIKRVLGTVPVEADGSAMFRVPANTPIAVQPLDENGRALQVMRSWFVGMPGEVVS
ncbi:MAG: formylglycine-generating enzyme family protein, partial [Phycisphaerae bacterium]